MDQDIKTVIQYPVGATEFDIPFDYLSRKFVRVSLVSDDNRRLLSNITEYRYVSKTRVKLLVDTTGFDRVEIRRFTSASERIVDFSDGSVLRAADLNVSQLQSAHIAEEARDSALMAMPEDDAGNLDARNRRIVRLAPGIEGTDAINKDQLDTTLGEAGGILSDIESVQKEVYQYIQNFMDNTTNLRGVMWVYRNGSAVGGETSIVVTKPERVFAVPAIYINGDRQEVGHHFDFDGITQTITLSKALNAGDFVIAVTAEGSIPLADVLASPAGAAYIGTSTGETVEQVITRLAGVTDYVTRMSGKVVFSKVKANTGADMTSQLQAEVSALKDGCVYYTNPGVIISQMIIFPTLKFVEINLTGTYFKRPDGIDPRDTDQIRFNRLNNAVVRGLYVDGNRDNLPVSGNDSQNLYGRVMGWRLGNSSSMVSFEDVTMVNQLYCGSQWGKDIRNVTVRNITFSEVGEHVFYISGKGGGNNKHVTFENIRGTNYGINRNNADEAHTCGVIKSAQSDASGASLPGFDNDNFIVKGIQVTQTTTPGYANVLVINGYLTNLIMDDVVVSENIGGVLSPLGRANNVYLSNVRGSSPTVGCPLVWTYPSGVEAIGEWVVRGLDMPGTYNQPHIQLFTLVEDFKIARFTTSADQPGTSFQPGRKTVLRRGIVNSAAAASTLQYVNRDFVFRDVTFSATIGGSLGAVDYIGQNEYKVGSRVRFIDCKFANAGAYSIGTYNDATQLELVNCYGGLKQIMCRASTGLAKLTMNNVEMSNSSQPAVVASRIAVKAISNVVTDTGARDCALYRGEWNIAPGVNTIGYDLTNVIIGRIDPRSVQVTPRTALNGATKFWTTVSGNTVSIVMDANATGTTTFNVCIPAGTQES